MIDHALLHAASEATWPAAASHIVGGVTVREGHGGGNRVSAATVRPGWSDADIAAAEIAMAGLGQTPMFMIRQGDDTLDAKLADLGYRRADATVHYAMALPETGGTPDPMTAFPHWPPLAIAKTIWSDHGIGADRLAVMDRATGPRTALLGRSEDHPAGVAFAAIQQDIACLHALVVSENRRRRGAGAKIMRMAAHWAATNGATRLALAVTATNVQARALYASLGMEAVGQYHYRLK